MPITPEVRAKFLQRVYDHFRANNKWPQTWLLQKEFRRHGSVDLIAAEIGRDLVNCEQPLKPESIVSLTLKGIAECQGSQQDIENFLKAVRFIANRYLNSEKPEPISSELFVTELEMPPPEALRAAEFVFCYSDIWSGASTSPDATGHKIFTPRLDVWYYEDVRTLDDFFAAHSREREDARVASTLRTSGQDVPYTSISGLRGSSPPPIAVDRLAFIADENIRKLLRADIEELQTAYEHGAWKSVGFLAGSCCEGILLDLLSRRPDDAKKELGDEWQSKRSLKDLAKAAKKIGLIKPEIRDLVIAMKWWRDIIHPWRALKVNVPSQYYASTLVSLLNMLLVEVEMTTGGSN